MDRSIDSLYTLALESSCDETAVAVIKGPQTVLSNSVYSQAGLHEKYGGVVPEIASRNHVKKFSPLLQKALEKAEVDLAEIDLVSATYGPGLVGPLLVGLSLGKALAYGLNRPFLGVNHLEGHLFAHLLTDSPRTPFLALLVSGGHTMLIQVDDWGSYRILGETRDDAAGEAFDKVGYMTDLGYPAGPKIEELSRGGNPGAVDLPRPMLEEGLDFSFAGLKTAVRLDLKQNPTRDISDLLASFQEAVVDTLVTKTLRAASEVNCDRITAVGGVAANSRLRTKLAEEAAHRDKMVNFPPLEFCTDNAAMIGLCAHYRFAQQNETSSLSLGPEPSLKVG